MKIENTYMRPILVESVGEGNDRKLFITGNAVDVGVSRNNVMYSKEELQAAAQTLIGKPLLKNHDDGNVESIVGMVIEADFDGKNVPFKAEIDTDEATIVSKLEKGLINSVSIGADVKSFTEDDDGIIHPKGIEFLELSLVPVPGVRNATINQVISESFKVKKMEEKKIEQMEEELKKNKEVIENLEKKLSEEESSEKEKPAEQEPKPEPEPEPEPKPDEKSEEKFKALTEKMEKLAETVTKLSEKPKGLVEEKPKTEGYNLTISEMQGKPGMVEMYSEDCTRENTDPNSRRRWAEY